MAHKYLRCPVCGKLSKPENFQIHNIGGRHRFPDIMIQEISSEGRGKIRHEWHSEKLDFETRQELNKVFSAILSQALDDIKSDIAEIVEVEAEDEIKVEIEEKEIEKEKRKKKQKDGEIFKVKGEVEEEISEEISDVGYDDEMVEVDDEEVFQGGDDESLDMEEEEAFRVF